MIGLDLPKVVISHIEAIRWNVGSVDWRKISHSPRKEANNQMAGRFVAVVLVNVLLFSGCAHTHLRWNTTHQAKSLTEIYEQQVLDNLAMFVHDSNALPSFAYPNTGRSDVTDKGSIGIDNTWKLMNLDTEVLKMFGGRDLYETWGLTPVYDPRRLELMRCAYQHSLWCAGLCSTSSSCPNCDRIQRTFYLGDPSSKYASDEQVANGFPDDLNTFSELTGRTTPACFRAVKWFAYGDRKCLPKGQRCLKRGHYCGTYVWLREGGQDELTKLTMTILDYAFSSQAPKALAKTKEVTWFYDDKGKPIAQGNAAQIIKAVVPIEASVILNQVSENSTHSDTNKGLEELDPVDRAFKSTRRDSSLKDGPEREPKFSLPPIQSQRMGVSPLELELQLRNPQGGTNSQ